MPKIAKLYIRDENDDPVGTLVMDIEKIISMYQAIMDQQPSTSANKDEGVTVAADPHIRMVRAVNDSVAWYTNDETGEYWLQKRP